MGTGTVGIGLKFWLVSKQLKWLGKIEWFEVLGVGENKNIPSHCSMWQKCLCEKCLSQCCQPLAGCNTQLFLDCHPLAGRNTQRLFYLNESDKCSHLIREAKMFSPTFFLGKILFLSSFYEDLKNTVSQIQNQLTQKYAGWIHLFKSTTMFDLKSAFCLRSKILFLTVFWSRSLYLGF